MAKITTALLITFWMNVVLASDGQLCPDKTGSWYDPAFNGEGVNLEQIGPDKMAVYWYHEWAVASFQTGQIEINTGGYFSGVIALSGNTWNGTFSSFKGTKGKLKWNDGFVGLSQAERAASNISHILDKVVTWRISDLAFKEGVITARLILLSPDLSVFSDQTTQVQLIRLTIPDCWNTSKTLKSTASVPGTRLLIDGNGIDAAIARMRTDILSALALPTP